MKKLAFLALAMFVLVFALGCTGEQQTETKAGTSSGQGWTMTVNPTDVVEGGLITIDLRVENPYQEDMNNVAVDFKDVPKTYLVGDYGKVSGVSILPGQSYPVILQIDAKQPGTISGRNIKVCFDYDTEYYYDIGLKTKSQATEELQTESGASDGPLSVTVTGLENIFYENGRGTGSMTLDNAGNGKMVEFKSIQADIPVGTYIKNGSLSISTCSDVTTSADTPVKLLSSDKTSCAILSNDVAIANGLVLRTEVGVDKEQTDLTVERITGNVNYNYCYEIPLPTITINEV